MMGEVSEEFVLRPLKVPARIDPSTRVSKVLKAPATGYRYLNNA